MNFGWFVFHVYRWFMMIDLDTCKKWWGHIILTIGYCIFCPHDLILSTVRKSASWGSVLPTASPPWSTSQPYRFHLPGAALAQHLLLYSSNRKGIIEPGSVATPRLTSLNHQNRWGNLSELCDSPVIGVAATTPGFPFIGQNDQPVVWSGCVSPECLAMIWCN